MKTTFILLMLACFSFPATLPAQFTLEQVLGAPYTESLHGSKDGRHLAWVVNEKGVRNIWYTSLGATTPTLLTNYNTDDGLGIALQAMTPEHLFYVRGNGNNRNGEPANPASISPVPERQILRLRLADKHIDTLASVGSMELSPDGKALIYTKGKNVYRMLAAGGAEPKEELLLQVRAGVTSPTWSPDGTKIAFVSPRTDHSFVGVFEPGTDRIQWISPGLGFDEYPVWSPDGKRLAFLRRPGRSKDELRNFTGGNSYEIWVGSLSLIHISEPTRPPVASRMPSSA